MALAIHFDRLIREGAAGNYSEIARLTSTSPAWITTIMKLVDLPVPEQEGVLSGHPQCTRPAGQLRRLEEMPAIPPALDGCSPTMWRRWGEICYNSGMETNPRHTCGICSQLADREFATQKHGWEENDTHLPAAAGKLVTVRDLKPGSNRSLLLERCPECGTYYSYRSDYEYLANGSEDEQELTRLTADQAKQYLE